MPQGLALAIHTLVFLLLLAYIVSLLISFTTPFYTTPTKILKTIIKKFNLKKDQKFADLGCGDGRVVYSTHKMYGCTSVGYEISPVLLIYIKLSKLLFHTFNKKIRFVEEDFFKVDLSEYDVIYCNLSEKTLRLLEKKFKKELKKGCKVYSYKNELPETKGKRIRIDKYMLYEYTY